jgi:hypothetical protein
MKKRKIIGIIFVVFALVFAGCSNDQQMELESKESTTLTYEGQLKFNGLAEFAVDFDDIYNMPTVDRTVKHISSSGEETSNDITGVLLSDILSANGLDQQTLGSIRFTAGDGYAIDVPQEIIQEKEIILAWIFDGEHLDEKKIPLRIAIDDVRSMYYVSNLAEVTIGQAQEIVKEERESKESDKAIVMMDTALASLETIPYTYYDSEDMAFNAKDLFDKYVDKASESVGFIANDGYEKTESFDVVNEGFIKFTGEDAPLFTGKDLPKGMNVKYIMSLSVADVTFISVSSAMEMLTVETVDGETGVNLKELVEFTGLKADTYMLKASDGYEKEVTANDLAMGIVYLSDANTVTAIFNTENPAKSKVKELLIIEAGSNSIEEVVEESTVESTGESTGEVSGLAWVVTVDGLSDGSFDFDKERAERKLTLVNIHTEKKKNDEITPEDWQGYRVLDILNFLKVDDFNSIVVTAGDGYQVELAKDQVDDETILAVVKNGQPMTEEDNLIQLVQNTEFATTWVKDVAKITVK